MKIEARHVRRKQLSQYIDASYVKRERKVSETQNTSTSSITQLAKKRLSAEMMSNLNKRSKLQESVSFSSRLAVN
jgi:poly(A) polymerase